MDEILNVLSMKLRMENRHHEMTRAFQNLRTDEGRVVFALNLMKKYQLKPSLSEPRKNAKDSTIFREEGNMYFTQKDANSLHFMKSSEAYTKSVAFAPANSVQLSLAYANRSAALFKLAMYDACIRDIDRALALSYPEESKAKLYIRKAECCEAMNRKATAEEYFAKALEALENMKLHPAVESKFREKCKPTEKCHNIRSYYLREEGDISPPEILSPHPEIPCASDALAVKFNTEYGRHVVASRDIKIGETLVVEKPYSLYMAPEHFYNHCMNCLKGSWSSIPCEHCVFAMYCSEKCKETHWKKSHEYECPILGTLMSLEFNILGLFSMKMACQVVNEFEKNIQRLREEIELVEKCKDPLVKGFSEDGKLHSDQYRGIYSLATNTEKRSVPDLFGRSFNAAFIVYLLATQTTLFGEKLQDDAEVLLKNKDVAFLGGLILRQQQIIPSNIHSFVEEYKLDSIERGAAAMPFCSLFNHSCDPNIHRQSITEHIVVYSLYPIKKGEQIFENYGQHYAMQARNTRQEKLLQQFYFKCDCTPCVEAWPNIFHLPNYREMALSKSDIPAISKAIKTCSKYMRMAELANLSDEQNLLEKLIEILDFVYHRVKLPCREINEIVETIKRVYALNGNTHLFLKELVRLL